MVKRIVITFRSWVVFFAVVAGLLFVIWGQNKLLPGWRRWVNIGFIVTLVLIPLPIPIGFVGAIFLSTVLPGYGVFLYLVFPLAASMVFLMSTIRGIARSATVASA